MLFMLSSLYWCPWPCKSNIEATDVLFYAAVSLVVGLIAGYYLGRGARPTAEIR